MLCVINLMIKISSCTSKIQCMSVNERKLQSTINPNRIQKEAFPPKFIKWDWRVLKQFPTLKTPWLHCKKPIFSKISSSKLGLRKRYFFAGLPSKPKNEFILLCKVRLVLPNCSSCVRNQCIRLQEPKR